MSGFPSPLLGQSLSEVGSYAAAMNRELLHAVGVFGVVGGGATAGAAYAATAFAPVGFSFGLAAVVMLVDGVSAGAVLFARSPGAADLDTGGEGTVHGFDGAVVASAVGDTPPKAAAGLYLPGVAAFVAAVPVLAY